MIRRAPQLGRLIRFSAVALSVVTLCGWAGTTNARRHWRPPLSRVPAEQRSDAAGAKPFLVLRLSDIAGADPGAVALTFDDGPSPDSTPRVLAVLAEHGAKATFFAVGRQAAAYPDVIRQLVASGNAIGNHTWDHMLLPGLTESAFSEQVDNTSDLLSRVAGQPVRCVRPPAGKHDASVDRRLARRGLAEVLWSVDSGDWKMPGPDAIASRVLSRLRPDAVILLHDAGPEADQTLAALPRILDGISRRGLRFATICDRELRPRNSKPSR
jgi:peptidoglycan/xylan/chitin deacetylase (PgdA/CDA1 family)